jgi:hypothetical protein
MPSTGDLIASSPTRRSRSCHQQLLAVALQAARLQLELEASFSRPAVATAC